MSELRDRIAAVARNHQLMTDCRCRCGHTTGRWWAWTEHLADAVIRELKLREEWGALDEQDGGFLADTREELTVGRGETLKHRYITDWEPAE